MGSTRLRILFASVHGYIDPSSGAAQTTRGVLELLAALGHDCRALTTGVLDYEAETPLESLLASLGAPVRRARAKVDGPADVGVFDLMLEGVRVTLLQTASSRLGPSPSRDEARAWLHLSEQACRRFRPHVLLTYGGHPAVLALIKRARQQGIATVFHLHNFAYSDRTTFEDATAVLVPSEFSRRYHAESLNLDSTAIPPPVHPNRITVTDPEPRYLTFVNPVPAKGLTVFSRIALELGRRRPEIPLLVVEGRGSSDWLTRVPLDLSGLENLHRMGNTIDARDFYRVSRALLVPSLWRESFGRVAAEAICNGLPVLASDRGALPETLGLAGKTFPLPERCTPTSAELPTAAEIEPWISSIERLWDDPAFESEHRSRALGEAPRWADEHLAEAHVDFFQHVAKSAR